MVETDYRKAVEEGGAIFDSITDDVVRFRESAEGRILSLWAIACNPENVRLACNVDRERAEGLHWKRRAREVSGVRLGNLRREAPRREQSAASMP